MSTVAKLIIEDLKSSIALRNQYEKEYFDATYRRGLCAGMRTFDRLSIATELKEHINSLDDYIRELKNGLEEEGVNINEILKEVV